MPRIRPVPTTTLKKSLDAVATAMTASVDSTGAVDLSQVQSQLQSDARAAAALAVVASEFARNQSGASTISKSDVKNVMQALLDAKTRVDDWDTSKDGKLQKKERDQIDVASTSLADKLAIGALGLKPTTTTTTTTKPLADVIAGAKSQLFVRLDGLPDKATSDALKAAVARGVDVRVVIEAKDKLNPFDVLTVLGIEAQGIDVTVLRDASTLSKDAAIADGASYNGGATDAFAKALGIDRTIAKRKLLAPEQVVMHEMPESGHAPIVGLIKSASTSIDLELYQLTDPTIVEALIDAAKRGVTVRVMLEPKTVGAQNFDAISKRLGAAGVQVKTTPPQFDANHNVDHAKFMIIDGKEMLFGSGNLVRSGMGGMGAPECNTRDFWFEDSRAQQVGDAKKLFDSDWDRTQTTPDELTHLIVTPDNADSRVLALIDSAKAGEPLLLWNQSLDDADVIAKLIAAKERGVDVHVLLGDQPMGPHGKAKNQATVDALAAKGIAAKIYTGHYLHAKGIVTASQAFVGSQNFTAGGLAHNREVGEIFDDADVVAKLRAIFVADEAM